MAGSLWPLGSALGQGTMAGWLDGWMARWTDWLRRRSTSCILWYVALPLLFINEFWISWENGRLCRYSCACALLPWFVSGRAATSGTYDDWRPRRRGCCCGRPVVTWWDNLLLHWHLLSVTVSVQSLYACVRGSAAVGWVIMWLMLIECENRLLCLNLCGAIPHWL